MTTRNFNNAQIDNFSSSGIVAQVVTTTFTNAVTSNTTNWIDIDPSYAVTITPRSTTSLIMVKAMLHIGGDQSTDGRFTFLRLRRNTTTIGNGSTAGTGGVGTVCIAANNWGFGPNATTDYIENQANTCVFYLDSPASTSPLTYKLQWNANPGNTGTTRTAYLNRNDSHNNAFDSNPISTIAVLEILQGASSSTEINENNVTWDNWTAPGSIVQVQSTTYNGNAFFDGFFFADIDASFFVTITPRSSSSTFLIEAMLHVGGEETEDSRWTMYRITRNGTPIGLGDTSQTGGNGTACTATGSQGGDGSAGTTQTNIHIQNIYILYEDIPATTSPLTYRIQWAPNPNDQFGPSVRSAYMNRTFFHTDGFRANTISTLTVFEIGH